MAHLNTPRLIISPAHPSMLDQHCDYLHRNRAFHGPWSPLQPEEWYTEASQLEILERAERAWEEGSAYRFWYAALDDPGRMIGHVTLSNVVRGAFQSCYLGYSQDEQEGGKGYMTEAIRAVLAFAFREAGLHRVEASVIPQNAASVAVLRRLGFRQEGEAKRYLRINGDWQDHLRFAILKEEFVGED